jgi:hypothetical protein
MLNCAGLAGCAKIPQIGWDFKKRTHSDLSLRCYYELFIR